MPPPVSIAPEVFTLFDALSFLASIVGLILAVVAMVLSWMFKRDADVVNAKTQDLLTEIKSDAKLISQGVMGELRAYGESMRGTFTRNPMTSASVVPTVPGDLHVVRSTCGP